MVRTGSSWVRALVAGACVAGCTMRGAVGTTPAPTGAPGGHGGAAPTGAISGAGGARAGAVDAGLARADDGGATTSTTGGAIVTVPTGGAVSTIVVGDGGATERVAWGVVVDVALDASHVYFADLAAGTVARAPKAGGAVETLATGLVTPVHVAVGAGHVYVQTGDGRVQRVPVTGGAPSVVGASNAPGVVAVGPTLVAWGDGEFPGAVWAAPIGGGDATKLVAGKDTSAGAVGVSALAVDATSVFFADVAGLAVLRVPIGGGAVSAVAEGLSTAPAGLALAGGAAWFAQGAAHAVVGVPLGGGAPVVLGTADYWPGVVAVDATAVVYGGTSADGAGVVRSVALAGGAPVTVVAELARPPRAIALDAARVWFADGEGVMVANR
jgi:hypothetical protein